MPNSAGHRFEGCSWFAAACVICLILAMMPRSMAVVAPLFMLAALVAARLGQQQAGGTSGQGAHEGSRWGELALGALALLALWALISAMWSPVPAASASKALYLFLLVTLIWAVRVWPPVIEAGARDGVAHAFVTTICLLGILLTVEVATGEAVNRWILTNFEFLRPNTPKHIHVADGVVVGRTEAELNRRIALLSVLIWPAVLVASLWLQSQRQRALNRTDEAATDDVSGFFARVVQRPLLIAGGAGAFVAIAASGHQSSQAALVAGVVVFLLVRSAPRVALLATAAAWVAATLFIVPLALSAYSTGLYESPWLFHSARHRVVIWHETARHVPNAPLLGVGADATPAINRNLEAAGAPQQHGEFTVTTGRHAHNFYLQIWYELGGIGAAIMFATGLLTLAAIWMLPSGVRPMAMAHFAAMAMLVATSYGVWQMWLQAAVACSVFIMLLALSCYRSSAGSSNAKSGEGEAFAKYGLAEGAN